MKSSPKETRSKYRLGRLRNGNAPAPLERALEAPTCGARTRNGGRCGRKAMKNGRCRLHGGLSTRAKTPEGRERARLANYRHGRWTREAIARRKRENAALRAARTILAKMEKGELVTGEELEALLEVTAQGELGRRAG